METTTRSIACHTRLKGSASLRHKPRHQHRVVMKKKHAASESSTGILPFTCWISEMINEVRARDGHVRAAMLNSTCGMLGAFWSSNALRDRRHRANRQGFEKLSCEQPDQDEQKFIDICRDPRSRTFRWRPPKAEQQVDG